MLTTAPGAADVCICSHNGAAHDPTTQVCRFQVDGKGAAQGKTTACGCQTFSTPGTLGSRPPVTSGAPLSGNDNN
jgi:hypothetical protein